MRSATTQEPGYRSSDAGGDARSAPMLGGADFALLTDPYRPELLAYCYRMLGSVHDAEDQLQEILIRAWRSYGQFEGRASVRTWLYRIAANSCLRALENRGRRPLQAGLAARPTRTGRLTRPRPRSGGSSPSLTCCSTRSRPTRPRSSRPVRTCGWPSSPPCSTCPAASARC